jgi:hypothetical protein
MELTDNKASTPTRSWASRVEKKHPSKIEYYSELRSWLQRAILEAEKTKNFNKKDQLFILLKDL